MSAEIIILGPQRLNPTLAGFVREYAPRAGRGGHVAVITAGWEERELELDELEEHLGGHVINLELYRRSEDVFQRDPELLEGMRKRFDRIRKLQRLYRLRLSHSLAAARDLLRRRSRTAVDDLLEREITDAIELVRVLDAQHGRHLRELNGAFEEEWRLVERDSVAAQRREILQVLADAGLLFIAGGHVAILLNRLRMFDLVPHLAAVPTFAWSAGAMVLTERIIVFHDHPPQGAGDPEFLEFGLGLLPSVVALPQASRRLRLDDSVRVELFARRFFPQNCIALDPGSVLAWNGADARPFHGTRVLHTDGTVGPPQAET